MSETSATRAAGSSAPACSACRWSMDLRAADTMAKIIDGMVSAGRLDARSTLADARLDYGQPGEYRHTPNKAL